MRSWRRLNPSLLLLLLRTGRLLLTGLLLAKLLLLRLLLAKLLLLRLLLAKLLLLRVLLLLLLLRMLLLQLLLVLLLLHLLLLHLLLLLRRMRLQFFLMSLGLSLVLRARLSLILGMRFRLILILSMRLSSLVSATSRANRTARAGGLSRLSRILAVGLEFAAILFGLAPSRLLSTGCGLAGPARALIHVPSCSGLTLAFALLATAGSRARVGCALIPLTSTACSSSQVFRTLIAFARMLSTTRGACASIAGCLVGKFFMLTLCSRASVPRVLPTDILVALTLQ